VSCIPNKTIRKANKKETADYLPGGGGSTTAGREERSRRNRRLGGRKQEEDEGGRGREINRGRPSAWAGMGWAWAAAAWSIISITYAAGLD